MNKYKFPAKIVSAIIICTTAGFLTGFKADQRQFDLVRNLDIFNTLFKELELYYVDSINNEKVIKNGIDAMLSQLDPYTTYIPESEQEEFATITTGEYGGIGSVITQRGDTVYINAPYEGSPSQVGGLKAGDAILAIDGIPMIGKSVSQVSEKLKGEPDTELKITIYRATSSEKIDKSIIRQKIQQNAVPYYGMLNDSIGYIGISSFTDKAAREVKAALLDLKSNPDFKGLILDLRDNPGGILEDAVSIVNMFVPKGKTVLTTKGKIKNWDKTYKATQEPIDTITPLAVMISSGSASASEIVSGALQDLDRAVIVGERSFGKGLVQSTRPLPYNGLVKITSAKYYIPSGRLIQAIDYSNRNPDGSVGRIPDSLTHVFKTANGRDVRDGGGITPDVKLTTKRSPNIVLYLFRDYVIFDYATQYAATHQSIASPEEFRLTDTEYADFIEFAKSRNFTYDRQSERVLEELKKIAEFEGYYDDAQSEFSALEAKFNHDIERDLNTFKPEIEQLIKQDIVSRYYYNKGLIRATFSSDTEVINTLELMADKKRFNELLQPEVVAEAPAKGKTKKK